ncbi:MAG: sigma-70 family RNA polymerase sigma factor [Lachnospiraceae bacterium]|nr:sigma-70 family RNA polymerase sigma factor [Lachnospiraceae bacterium]
MQDYSQYTDEELLVRLRDGEEAIMDYLIGKYKGLVRKRTKSLFLLGADYDDLLQEGMIGLFKAIREYDFGRDASFYTFADLCITRQAYTAAASSNSKKHSFLNSYVSLYEDGAESEEGRELLSVLAAPAASNPEKLLIDQESLEQLLEQIAQELSDLELQVLDLKLVGMSYTEIARVLGKPEKAIDNALTRIKTKIKRGMNSVYKDH